MEPSPAPPPTSKKRSGTYAASWSNWLGDWVDRLPGSSWSYYLGFWLVLVVAQIIVLWAEGADPLQTYHIAQAFQAAATAFMLGMFHFMDRRAAKALSKLKPVIQVDDTEYETLEYRLTRLPFVGSLIAVLVAIGVLLLSETAGAPYWLETTLEYPISLYFMRILYILSWGLYGVFIYQTLHRLHWINWVYTQRTQINLFRKKPLYPLSNLTALSAAGLTVLPIGFFLANEVTTLSILDPVSIIFVFAIQSIAFLSFLWPQLGIQRLQRAEKDRLLDEVNQRYEKTFLELHRRIDDGELDKTGDLNTTFTLLEKELKNVKGIPVWPWDPETLRWLVTALVLPVGFMVLQLILQRFFN